MSQLISVKKKVADSLRFLKNSKKVFSSFKELNGRKEKFVNGSYTWEGRSYTRSEIVPDYLLLLNVNKTPSSGKSIGISITYKDLNEEDSYFIASVADFKVKKNEFGYSSNDFLEGSNIQQSCKMNYAEFSSKLRAFNKEVKNITNDSDVVEKFADIMGIFSAENEEEKSKLKTKLEERYKEASHKVETNEKNCQKLNQKIEKAGKKFEEENGITSLKKEKQDLLDKLRILQVELDKKEKEKQNSLQPLLPELAVFYQEISNGEKEKEEIVREAKNVIGDTSFLKK